MMRRAADARRGTCGGKLTRRPEAAQILSETRMTRSFCFLNEIGADAPLDSHEANMSAPVIRGLAATIRGAVVDLTKLASEAAAELAHEVEGFRADVDDVRAVAKDVRAARAEVRAALGQGTNGAPPDDHTRASAPPCVASSARSSSAEASNSPGPQGASPSSPLTLQRTPIGFVPRRT
jgi:hypothetical protein